MEEKIAIHEMSISNLIYWLYAFFSLLFTGLVSV